MDALAPEAGEWVRRAQAQPAATAVLSDFDGTLSEIVLDPATAVPLPGVPELLGELSRSYATVAVISGRPVSFLRAVLPTTVHLSGLYGLEEVRDGVELDHPDAAPWRPVVADLVERARAAVPTGVGIEPKGLSVTLHYRANPALEPAVTEWAEAEAARTGLHARSAKRSVELHPPVPADKGTAVQALAGRASRVCYLGDDLGDLPAFAALEAMRDAGRDALRVAVRSRELAPEVRKAADHLVDGPTGARDFLAALAL